MPISRTNENDGKFADSFQTVACSRQRVDQRTPGRQADPDHASARSAALVAAIDGRAVPKQTADSTSDVNKIAMVFTQFTISINQLP